MTVYTKNWDLFSDHITYVYSTPVHRTSNCAPFYLLSSRLPTTPASKPTPTDTSKESCGQHHWKWKPWTRTIVDGDIQKVKNQRRRYQGYITSKHHLSRETLSVSSHVFVRKEYFTWLYHWGAATQANACSKFPKDRSISETFNWYYGWVFMIDR